MPMDNLLGTLLRSLRTHADQQDTPRLLESAASLLTSLSNPLNVTLLTSQLLLSPAIWERPDGLQTCLRMLSLFHSAALGKIQQQEKWRGARKDSQHHSQLPQSNGLECEEWIKAVIGGADEKSDRWQHLLVIGGILIGFESRGFVGLTRSLKITLESALVKATNLALEHEAQEPGLGSNCVALVSNHTFPILSDSERMRLNYDRLLPLLVAAIFFSPNGLESGYFLGTVDLDIIQVQKQKFDWSSGSDSFRRVQRISSRPLVSSMGPLSRLIAHAVENVRQTQLIQEVLDNLVVFSKTLLSQWRQNKFSEVDVAEESRFLTDETSKTTLPVLWHLLKSALFGTVVMLRGILSRVLSDGALSRKKGGFLELLGTDVSDHRAEDAIVAISVLRILRSLYFISSRLGSDSFSQYTFVYLTAIDILNSHPNRLDQFVQEIRPAELGQIPQHPLDRCLDLYFLNTSEYFTLSLSSDTNEHLLVTAAHPYLVSGSNDHFLPIFEAAHSVMLAVLSAPQSAALTAQHLPFYVDALFKVFPQNLSSRQFRLAFKTLIHVVTPPSPLSASQPNLPSVLLELVHHRVLSAPQTPLERNHAELGAVPPEHVQADPQIRTLSERAVLALTLIDSLPYLPIAELQEWLPLASSLANTISDSQMRGECRKRFWEVLNGGEMDPERGQVCVAWWSTRGGREELLFGWEEAHGSGGEEAMMSGALPPVHEMNKL
ncbi:MAG: hypothetical protein Q9165_000293 [Trypethelium subeluteriae]